MSLPPSHEPIAIIGIGCVFPGARGPDAFWQLLQAGREAIRTVPPERFDPAPFHDPTLSKPGKIASDRAGFIDAELDKFEPGFFGISPREAACMDPQQRLLLEVTWEAVEDAGLTRDELRRSSTGVFVGMSSADYGDVQMRLYGAASLDVYTLAGTARSILAGRISHAFDLSGPSVALDTACSSSLVAVQLACQSIWTGECKLAIAGGVNLILSPEPWTVLSMAHIISPDGRARVFDARANGFVRGEGAGVVLLKPLAQAQADGDPIVAVIRGCATNNDGRNSSLMTPNGEAQEAVLRAAYRHAGVAPGDVQYVEAHGTGTAVGDPIELRALGAVIREGRAPDSPCRIGSTKTNIGHLEAAAGIASLIKVALCLKHRAIPPSLHFEEPNPLVPWAELPLMVQQTTCAWPAAPGAALAGVSSFGISGTNVHVVLADVPPAPDAAAPDAEDAYLLPLSAHTPAGLAAAVARFHDFLAAEGAGAALRDLCYTAGVRRNHQLHRAAFTARTHAELQTQLAAWLPPDSPPQTEQPGPVFVFSGQGARFWPLDPALLRRFPVFAQTLRRCDELLTQLGADWSLLDQLTAADDRSRLQETDVCQAAIFACQVALATLWQSWGIAPAAVVGHSLGEIAAAHIAGALSLEQAVHLVWHRGHITKQAVGLGAMALVGLPADAAREALAGHTDALAVAVVNSPTNCVISGDPAALDLVAARLEDRGVFVRRLPAIDYAAHSPQMEPLKHELAAALDGLMPAPTTVPFYSTVFAAVRAGTQLDAGYWAANLREPVQFAAALHTLLEDGHRLFLEVHPTQVLQRPVQEGLLQAGAAGTVFPSLQRDADGPAGLLRTLGGLYAQGCRIRWDALYPARGRHVHLPTTPWQRSSHWLSGDGSADPYAAYRPGVPGRHPLLGVTLRPAPQPGTYLVQTELAADQPGYLTDHRMYATVVLPATAYVELALAIAHELGLPGPHTVADFVFEKALVLPDQGRVLLQVAVTAAQDALTLEYFSAPVQTAPAVGQNPTWQFHGRGTVRQAAAVEPPPGPVPVDFQAAAEAQITQDDHYARMTGYGLHYGPRFRGLAALWQRGLEALAQLDLHAAVTADLARHQLHPVLLDLAFQSVAAVLQTGAATQTGGPFLPVGLKSLHVYASPAQAAYTYAVVRSLEEGRPRRVVLDAFLLDAAGQVLVAAHGLVLQQIAGALAGSPADLDRCLYQVVWRPQELPAPPVDPTPARWLVVGGADGLGQELARAAQAADRELLLIRPGSDPAAPVDLACPDSAAAFVAELAQSARPPAAILYLAGLDAPADPDPTPTGRDALLGLVHLVQALIRHEATFTPRLWVVTRGTQPMADDPIALDQTPLAGLARTLALEYPKLGCTQVDLAADPAPDDAELVYQAVLAGGDERQIAYRQGQRWAARLVRCQPEPAVRTRPAAPTTAFRLEIPTPGILDHLTLTATERVAPAPDQVEIEVRAAGLNFLDVLSALGLRPDQTGDELALGMECAGVITQVGRDVQQFRVGDAVLGVAPHAFGRYTCTPADLVVSKPAGLSFVDAATIPVAYLTAYYALHTLGRIRRGERILIHAAAGGVGLAAVHLALAAGAEVFATAGSPEKRAYLAALGVPHVFDSRTLDFAGEIMDRTRGQGVDLVLNSLAGEAIPASLATLRANGRFLEIGKRDIYGHSKLDMGLLKRNISFHAIDLIPLLAEQPAFCREMLDGLADRLVAGELPPLPATEFPIAQAEQAFRYMAQAKHTGKVVITVDVAPEAAPIPVAPRPRTRLRPDATYLITGGLGGLGLATAGWLVAQGARHLVLVSRRGPTPAVRAALDALAGQGAEVVTLAADVAHADDLRGVLDHIAAELSPLRGVFHAAGVLDDGLLLHLDAARFDRVLAPKAQGAWLLHQLTRDLELDLFVLFSSATSVLGSPGQANYVAANAFLDGLAHYRDRLGLPALVVNWGAWAEVGLATQSHQTAHLAKLGMQSLAPEFGVQLLGHILATPAVQVTAMQVDWPLLCRHYPLPLLAEMASAADADASGKHRTGAALRAQLAALDPEDRRAAVTDLLREQIAQVLRIPAQTLNPRQPLREVGIDSLMTVELVHRIENELDVKIPLTTLLQGPTLVDLADMLVGLLEPSLPALPDAHAEPAPDEHFACAVVELEPDAALEIAPPARRPVHAAAPTHILLTGGTGFLGTFLLRDLLHTTAAQIHCLVRAADPASGHARLRAELDRVFPGEPLDLARIDVIPGDLTQPQLGLAAADFARLAEETDLILHGGAHVNWLAPYAQLKPANVAGTATLIRLAAARGIPFHYISTLAVFPFLGLGDGVTFDEHTQLDHGGVLHGGYAQSKWVAEKLVATAYAQGLPGAVYRPSLVAGHSRTGAWQGDSIVVDMLRICIELGAAPDLEAEVDLVPVDYVSRAIVDLLPRAGNGVQPVYHLNNPQPVTVGDLIDWLVQAGYPIRRIPYAVWRRAVMGNDATRGHAVGPLLALQLAADVAWLQHLPKVDSSRTQQALGELACPPVDAPVFRNYVDYLRRAGVLPAVS